MRSLVVHLLLNYTCNQLLSLDFSDVLVSVLIETTKKKNRNQEPGATSSHVPRRGLAQQQSGLPCSHTVKGL